MNILITSVSRKVWLVNAFRAALKSLGIEGKVVSVDTDPLSAGFYLSDRHYVVPLGSNQEFIPKILEICGKEDIRLVVPTRNGELSILAENKDMFEMHGIRILVSDAKVVEICKDKYRFYRFLTQNDICAPKTFLPDQVEYPSIKYPLMVKPRIGSGGKNTFKVENEKELKFFIKYVSDPIVQEFVGGKEFTVDSLSDFDGNVLTIVPRERIETFGGESFKGRTVKDYEIIRQAKKLVERLGTVGHVTIQCLANGKSIKFTEVNPRFGGGAALGIAAGANTPLLILRLILGEKIKPIIGEFAEGIIMLRYTEDIFLNGNTSKRVTQ